MVNLLLDRGADINAQRGGSALQTAAKWRHLDMLKLLVGRGASINAPSNEEGGVLSAAVYYDDSCFQYLLDNGADVNMSSTGEGKCTALCATALHKNWRLFDLLLERGADVNIGGIYGYPLFHVIAAGDLPRIKQLLSFGADLNAKGGYPVTALGAVCDYYREDQKLYIQIAQYLIDNGADVNMPPSALALCASYGYTPLARLLLQNGADVNLQGDLGSALQAACIFGKLEMMQLLLDHGADVNAQGGGYGTALHAVCISRGFPDIAERVQALRLLLQHGADANVWSSEYGPLLQAVCGYFLYDDKSDTLKRVAADLVPILLDNDANVNAQGGEYGTALQAACFRNPDIVQLLLDHGADVNAQGGEHGTALQAACLNRLSTVQLLLDHGTDVHAVGGNYGTALQAACKRNKLQIVRLLLDHGADVHVCSGLYGTAIQAACGAEDNGDLIQLLLDRGADVNADGGQYGTALQISCHRHTYWRSDKIEVIRMLLEHGADPLLRRGQYGSPLHHAAIHAESDALSQLLLEYGADINQVVNDFGTALHFGLCPQRFSKYHFRLHGWETWWIDRIRFLLDHGADVGVRGGEYDFPLQAACAVQCEDWKESDDFKFVMKELGDFIRHTSNHGATMKLATEGVKMLLDKRPDIDINAHGGIFGTALQAAAYSGQTKTIKLLLGRKDRMKCNERCGKYGSALNAAVIRGYWDIVQLLLEAGEEPDCHLLQEPDEKFLTQIREEHGWVAEERYKKFWEVEKRNS